MLITKCFCANAVIMVTVILGEHRHSYMSVNISIRESWLRAVQRPVHFHRDSNKMLTFNFVLKQTFSELFLWLQKKSIRNKW